MGAKTHKLSNAQLELLKAFRRELSEEVCKNIANFFAKVLMNEAEKV